jgi:putative spermidine/putrescine transport system substrate-binding protein
LTVYSSRSRIRPRYVFGIPEYLERGGAAIKPDDSLLERLVSRRDVLKGGLCAGAGLLLAACGSKGAITASSSPAGSVGGSPRVPATKPDKLIVRAWGDPWSTALGDFPGKAFTAETGIPVQFDLSDHAEVQTKVQLALQAGRRPPVDVVYTIGTFAYTASVQNLSVPFDTDVVANFAKLTVAGKPVGERATYVNLYTYTYPVIYTKTEVQFDQGTPWSTIWDSKYKQSMHADEVFTSLLFPVAKILNLDVATADLQPVWDRIAELRPNIASVGDDTVFIQAMKSHDTKFGLALVGDALALKDGGLEVAWVVPAEGVALTSDSMYVCRGLPQDVTYWAQVFVNKVIEAQIQSQWCAKVGTVPTNAGASPAPFMKGDPAFPFSDEEIAKYALIEPIDLAAQNNDAWQSAYRAAIKA